MSAPDTNIDEQAQKHKGAMVGMKAVLAFVALLFVGFILWTSYKSGEPQATTPVEIVSGSG